MLQTFNENEIAVLKSWLPFWKKNKEQKQMEIAESTMVSEGCPNVDAEPEVSVKPKKDYKRHNPFESQGYLQVSHQTRVNRFPKIFEKIKSLRPNAKRILSFGCSTGEECFTLAEHFPNAEIVGVDIDWQSIQTARRNNKKDNVYFHTDLGATGTYDLVTCLMVLFCMEYPIKMEPFSNILKKIDKYTNPNGILALYTCEYRPTLVPEIANNYEVLHEWERVHNKNKQKYWCGYYKKKDPDSVIQLEEPLKRSYIKIEELEGGKL